MMGSDSPGGCELVDVRAELITKLIEDTCPRKRSSRRTCATGNQDQDRECDVFALAAARTDGSLVAAKEGPYCAGITDQQV